MNEFLTQKLIRRIGIVSLIIFVIEVLFGMLAYSTSTERNPFLQEFIEVNSFFGRAFLIVGIIFGLLFSVIHAIKRW